MQFNVSRSGERTTKVTATERNILIRAKALCSSLARVWEDPDAQLAAAGRDGLGAVLAVLDREEKAEEKPSVTRGK